MRHTIGMSFTDEDTRNCVLPLPCNERTNERTSKRHTFRHRIRGIGHNERVETFGRRTEDERNGWQCNGLIEVLWAFIMNLSRSENHIAPNKWVAVIVIVDWNAEM